MQNKIIYIFNIILLIFIIILKFIFIDNSFKYYELINCIFWLISLFSIYKLIGFKKDNHIAKSNTTQIIIIAILLFILLTYLSGMFFGFLKNAYSLEIISIIKNIYPLVIMVVSQELIRYMVAKKDKTDIKPLIILTILYIVLDIVLVLNPASMTDFRLFVFITNTCLPIITRNVLCSYLTFHVSYVPSLIYRLFFTIYIYIFPIFPDYGNYISSLIGILLPYFIYLVINNQVMHMEKKKIISIKDNMWILSSFLIILAIFMVCLVSGIFKYQLLAIGSGSMEPVIYKGDAIIFEKIDEDNLNKIKEDTIIVYRHNGDLVIHRVIDIKNNNGKINYITKGDNNLVKDDYLVSEDNVVGIVSLKIKYLGLPTIWFHELFNKGV